MLLYLRTRKKVFTFAYGNRVYLLELYEKVIKDKKHYSLEDSIPFEPIHPGEMLLDELQARGISQRKFAEMIECSCSFLNEIIRGKRSISALTACRIEAATGINAQIWVNLQAAYDMQVVRNDKKFSSLLAKIRRAAAIL